MTVTSHHRPTPPWPRLTARPPSTATESTMSHPTRAQRARPANAPAYYLGRPAGWWITALPGRRRPSREATGCTGARTPRPAA